MIEKIKKFFHIHKFKFGKGFEMIDGSLYYNLKCKCGYEQNILIDIYD